MNAIAILYGDTLIYWHGIVLALGCAVGILFFLSAWTREKEAITGAALACPLVIFLSLFLGRLLHWYFLPDSYEGLAVALLNFSSGGFALMGAFAGCLLTGILLRLTGRVKNLPRLLDCMSIGGCGAMALGRLGCFFTSEDRGQILSGVTSLPLVYPVVNPTSGALEYRLAVFLFQSVIAGILFAILWCLLRKKHRDGDIALLFLLLYCATQVVLDSTRYDCLRLRSNGFISAVQVLSAMVLVIVIGVFSIRQRRGSPWKYLVWPPVAVAIGIAGFMEYYVQRHGDRALLSYGVMGVCMAVIVTLGVILWRKTNRKNPRFARV